MEAIVGFIVAGFALAGSPGPNTLSLAATGAAFGVWRSLAYMIGASLGVVLVMVIVASGVTAMLLAIPGVGPVLVGIAAAYFVYLAWRIATAPPLAELDANQQPPSLWAGVVLSLINPKAYAAMGAMFSGFTLIEGRVLADDAAKIAVLTGVIFAVNIAWLLLGAALTRWFREPRLNRIVNITFAVLLLASLAALLL